MQTTFNISLSQAGLYTTVWGVGVVLGGVSGGSLLSKLGRKNAVLSTLAFTLVAIAALSLIPSKLAAWPIIFLFGLAFGAYQAQYYALSMAFTEKSIAASMYAILMAMSNIGIAAGLSVSGILSDALLFPYGLPDPGRYEPVDIALPADHLARPPDRINSSLPP